MTLHEVAEAARIIQEAVDEEANIISGMVIDEALEEAMKVTVIATGFDLPGERTEPLRREPRDEVFPFRRPQGNEAQPAAPRRAEPAPRPRPVDDAAPEEEEHVPFYRKVIAHARGGGDDPKGYGPNWQSVDDYDIPTVLRKQMD